MGLRGIKNRVFIQFWILFFLSMLFIEVLVVFIFLEKTISRYTNQKQFSLMVACEKRKRYHTSDQKTGMFIEKSEFAKGDRFIFVEGTGLSQSDSSQDRQLNDLETAVYQTLDTGQVIERRVGKIVGLFFFQPKSLIVTYPVQIESKTVAAGGVETSLTGIYQDFGGIQKIAFIFVVINSFFFALYGNFQLSRIYFKPLKRLAKRAETYQDEGTVFFSVRKEDNEFAVLSSSLNIMLHRIADDKRVLKETIDSLKVTNVELKKVQGDVIRAEKLATVGRLTSGIAHEIGNPLGIVLGYLDLLKQVDLPPADRNDFITRSENEITRINNIIRQLLDMSRFSPDESKQVSIHQLLKDLVSVFNYQPAAADIIFESNMAATDDFVFADPDGLRQVFLNILMNAIDAVTSNSSTDSRITILTENFTSDGDTLGDQEGKFVKVIIKDNGPGIDTSILPQVFDPFFTTKQPGKGTGLGLSVSFMIVEKLGGHIFVTNSEARGAVFHVILPLETHGAT